MLLEPLDNGRDWLSHREIKFVRNSGEVLYCPAGTVTDGASIPRFLWRVIGPPMSGKWRRGAVIHDWEYRRKGPKRPRSDCDDILSEIMEFDGVGDIDHWTIMRGVRMFGGSSYQT